MPAGTDDFTGGIPGGTRGGITGGTLRRACALLARHVMTGLAELGYALGPISPNPHPPGSPPPGFPPPGSPPPGFPPPRLSWDEDGPAGERGGGRTW